MVHYILDTNCVLQVKPQILTQLTKNMLMCVLGLMASCEEEGSLILKQCKQKVKQSHYRP
jgi:hypothetical protein